MFKWFSKKKLNLFSVNYIKMDIKEIITNAKIHFQNVLEFNKAFEVTIYTGELKNIFKKETDLVNFRYSLIEEEINELLYAAKQQDFIEVIDALADILYVVFGMYSVLNIDIDHELKDISESTSELCNVIYQSKDLVEAGNIFANMPIVDCAIKIIYNCAARLKNTIEVKEPENLAVHLTAILFSAYSAAIMFKIDIDAAFKIVHESNMSKLCSSEKEAIKTMEYYKSISKGGKGYYDSPAYRESNTPGKWIVFNKNTSKILKNINYKPADFSSIL